MPNADSRRASYAHGPAPMAVQTRIDQHADDLYDRSSKTKARVDGNWTLPRPLRIGLSPNRAAKEERLSRDHYFICAYIRHAHVHPSPRERIYAMLPIMGMDISSNAETEFLDTVPLGHTIEQ